MKNIVKVIIALLIVMSIFSIYVWGTSYFDWRKENLQKTQEVYKDLGDNYQLGKHNNVNKICNKNEEIGCLNGEIKGFNQVNGPIYLFTYIYRSKITSVDINGKENISGYFYDLFLNNTDNYVKNENSIPKYLYLSNNSLKFYSENDLKNLSQEQQNIFKELEKNPTIIIDGVNYTNK